MKKNTLKVTAPVFLLRSTESCWRCHSNQEVIALAFRWSLDEDEAEDQQPHQGEPLILENIHEMPQAILDHIVSVHPRVEKRPSKTTGTAYFMNICKCGANFGDHYLFSEPGGAFFPMDEEAASQITIEELPFTGAFQFNCSYSMGQGDLIFEHGETTAK